MMFHPPWLMAFANAKLVVLLLQLEQLGVRLWICDGIQHWGGSIRYDSVWHINTMVCCIQSGKYTIMMTMTMLGFGSLGSDSHHCQLQNRLLLPKSCHTPPCMTQDKQNRNPLHVHNLATKLLDVFLFFCVHPKYPKKTFSLNRWSWSFFRITR